MHANAKSVTALNPRQKVVFVISSANTLLNSHVTKVVNTSRPSTDKQEENGVLVKKQCKCGWHRNHFAKQLHIGTKNLQLMFL